MGELHNILEKIINRNGTVVSNSNTRNVPAQGNVPINLCSVTIPAKGTWQIVSQVFETLNASPGEKVFQNRIDSDGKVGSYMVTGGAVGRTTSITNSVVYDLEAGATVKLGTYISTGNATEMYGAIWAIKVA